MSRLIPLGLSILVFTACGGSPPPEDEHASGDTLFTSAGGEDGAEAPEPISSGPAPLPIPTPPVPRGAMTADLQTLWTDVEGLLAAPPPAPPEGDNPNVEEWTATTFTAWLQTRMSAVGDLLRAAGDLGGTSAPLYERAIAAALVAHAMEDTVADVRGAPLPPAIAADPELVVEYRDALDDSLVAIAEQAAAGYQACALALDRHGDASWGEWRAYCFDRAEELEEIYADDAETPEDGGDD